MVKFIEQSFMRTIKKEYSQALDAILVEFAKRLSDGARDEEKHLDDIKADPHKIRSEKKIADDERDFLKVLLADWKSKPTKVPGKLTAKIIASYFPVIVLGFIRREVSPGNFSGPVDLKIGSALNNFDQAFTFDQQLDTDYLATQVYDAPSGLVSHSIKWALSFTRYRLELAQELQRVNQGRTVLAAPAIVDFAKWLDAKDPTPLAKQVGIMERLARERPSDTPHLHGFVAFDPLRQAIDENLGTPEKEQAFSIAKKAILEQGFIGIKLYPPMGFRITDNVGAGDDFPCWVRFGSGSPGYDPKCKNPKNTKDGLGNTPGKVLDDVLLKLMDWCSANNVPVMAHTNNTNGAGPGYETRADPKHWRKVFESFPALHVNMAHFGGFEEAFVDGKLQIARLDKTWEWTIGLIAEANKNLPLYADISYLSEVLAGNATARKAALACMTKFREKFAGSDKLLMYGSDWSMIGHEPNFTASTKFYPQLVADFLYDAGYKDTAQLENIFFKNAVRFLGLGVGEGTRKRLEKFHQADAGWMTVFD